MYKIVDENYIRKLEESAKYSGTLIQDLKTNREELLIHHKKQDKKLARYQHMFWPAIIASSIISIILTMEIQKWVQ